MRVVAQADNVLNALEVRSPTW